MRKTLLVLTLAAVMACSMVGCEPGDPIKPLEPPKVIYDNP
jgi:hypothetical protein